MAKQDDTDRMLDELVKGKNPEELLGKGGVLKQLTKRFGERALEGEMTTHLSYEKNAAEGKHTGNSRNGKASKQVKADFGEVELEVPRDRNGEFEPQLVKKGQRRLPGFDDKVIAVYARGMTTRDGSWRSPTWPNRRRDAPCRKAGCLIRPPWTLPRPGETVQSRLSANARAYMDELAATYTKWQTTMDLFLSPVVAAPPPRLGFLFDPELEFDVLYRRVFDYLSYTPVQNTLGVPAMSVPLGMSDTGLPIGSHFVAPAGREDLLYKLAYELEEAKPWAREWPPVSAEYL